MGTYGYDHMETSKDNIFVEIGRRSTATPDRHEAKGEGGEETLTIQLTDNVLIFLSKNYRIKMCFLSTALEKG